ncbi:MAG: reverse transcriptase domain-containing protein [Luteolibacter sp.]|jgi:retron-type reverse transcriptase|nr:reverse transcriptase domain-containing protein [Luteolibacter sp.]
MAEAHGAREHWERIASQLRKGIYHPAPVRRVFIPKPDGTERPLGIPTVLDRVIQQATAQVLTPLWDGEFSEYSFGFREGRNAHQAVRHMEGAWKLRRRHAVDCDLKAFFDTVKHDPLLVRLREKIGGGKLLRLIGRYLRAGVELPDGTREATPLGVPQGGPLSPLLYYWKQWKRPRTRRRNLLKLGANPKKVHMATRSRKGYWRMSRNKIVHQGLNNRWLKEQGVPEMRDIWIKLNYGDKSRPVSGV